MKIKRILISLLCLIGLFLVGGKMNNNVHAMPSVNSQNGMQWWTRVRHVRARYPFKAVEVYDTVPEYKTYAVKSKIIPKNYPLYVNYRGIEWYWTLGGRGLHSHGHYVWIAPKFSSNKWKSYYKHYSGVYLTLADRKYGVRVSKPYRHTGRRYVKSNFKRTNNDDIMDNCHYYYHQKNRRKKAYIGYIYCDYGPDSRKSYIPKPSDISAPMFWINNRTGTEYSYISHRTWRKIN